MASVHAQQALAEQGIALPVLDFKENESASEQVRKAVCSVHGIRPVVENICTCSQPVSVLLMPQADEPVGFTEPQITAFMDGVAKVCEALGITWDYTDRNVALYQGRLVALDFGNPDREDW